MFSREELLVGELIVEGRLVDASNATLFGKVLTSDQSSFSVVYKPIAGERALWDFADGNLASREVAAYLISEVGQFNCVPLTVMRDGPFGIGAVQQWIDVDPDLDLIAIGQQSTPAIRNIALFDVVINNTDRKFGHILPISDSQILGCDHGLTFHEEFKLRTVLWQYAGQELDKDEVSKLESLKLRINDDIGVSLGELITKDEINSLLGRIDMLISEGFPYPSEQWPAVPWPPV
ncbi:MAG: SCO1664 family protein [Actinobacteria bacterium]|nr:SCO1664 family protein [Actinomycetota bacterium]NBQ66224.1 SCO1664 family protein [Actinomycetota bacterium]NBY50365.1 SCO1664 family protein [Actinomycetota bacterium]